MTSLLLTYFGCHHCSVLNSRMQCCHSLKFFLFSSLWRQPKMPVYQNHLCWSNQWGSRWFMENSGWAPFVGVSFVILRMAHQCGMAVSGSKEQGCIWGDSWSAETGWFQVRLFSVQMQNAEKCFPQSRNTVWDYVKYSLFYISFKVLNQPKTVHEFVSAFPPVGKCPASLTSWPNNKDLGKTFVYRQTDDARRNTALGTSLVSFLVKPEHKGWYF